MTRKRMVLLLALAFIAAGLIWFWNSEWLQIDKCLDGGGRWNEATDSCQRATGVTS